MKHKPKIIRDIANRVMQVIGEKLIITKTVNELLFEGYNDTMLTIARKMKLTKIPMTKFAWFFEVSSFSKAKTRRTEKCNASFKKKSLLPSEERFSELRWNIQHAYRRR